MNRLFHQARTLTDECHGKTLTVYVPGEFTVDGRGSAFPTVSITGARCDLGCDHCRGTLLKTMHSAPTPDELLAFGRRAFERNAKGMLISGGCDGEGRLPWDKFLEPISRLRDETDLILNIHPGRVDVRTARRLKAAGVRQALVDVTGDDETATKVYRAPEGVTGVLSVMRALEAAGIEMVPHIVFGVYYGEERGERRALALLREFPIQRLIVVCLRPARGTPMEAVQPPDPIHIAEFLAEARLALPHASLSLGCARPGGRHRRALDELAMAAGINALAVPSPNAVECAKKMGLEVIHRDTCCSIP